MANLLERILVPVDFSSCSEQALHVALGYAVATRAHLTLLHVLSHEEYAMGSAVFFWTEDVLREARMAASARVEAAAEELRQSGVPYTVTVVAGEPKAEILAVASSTSAELVVMGTHGRTGLGRLAIGSVAQDVAAQSPCPVLLVRAAPPAAPRRA